MFSPLMSSIPSGVITPIGATRTKSIPAACVKVTTNTKEKVAVLTEQECERIYKAKCMDRGLDYTKMQT
jgi:hypothetical protein